MGWMMTFGDMVTLLLTFFVLLMTMASMDDKTFRDAWGAVVSPPMILKQELGGSSVFLLPPPIPDPQPYLVGSITTEKDVVLTIEEHLKQQESGEIQTFSSGRGVVIKFKESLLFSAHSSELSSKAEEALSELANKVLVRVDFDLIVEGSTDRQPLPAESNFANHLELSAARAFAVQQYLLAHSSISETKISCRGRGFRDCPPETPEDPTRNCVEIVIDTQTITK